MIRTISGLPFLTVKTRDEGEAYSLRSHSHREVSLGYIRSGETTINVDGQDFLLRRGDVVLIAAGTVHLCTPRDRDAFQFDMLYLDSRWWFRVFGTSPEGFPTLALPASPEIRRLIALLEEGEKDGKGTEEDFIHVLSRLVSPFQESQGEPQDLLEQVHREICRMSSISLSVDELAARAGTGKYTFIRKYAARYGLTPHADMVNMKIQRALLLFESDMSLAEIAGECGFSDQSHFTNQFKLYTGMTPREYRQGGLS